MTNIEEIKDLFGFLLIGQAASNIGRLLTKFNFKTLFINTAEEDLNTLVEINPDHKYKIINGEGCHKDRNIAKELAIGDIDAIYRKLELDILKKEIIGVVFSSGGGTGSGIGPLLTDYISTKNPDKIVCIITVFPSVEESIRTQINAYETFKEISEIKNLGSVFVLDNNKLDKIKINEKFSSLFDCLSKLPTYLNERGNIDKGEFKELLGTKGVSIIGVIKLNDDKYLNKNNKLDITEAIIKDIKLRNIFAPLENNNIIKYIAISCPILKGYPINYNLLKKELGIYTDIYTSYNDENLVIYVISGLSLPLTRLNQIEQIIYEGKDDVSKNIREVVSGKLNTDIDFINILENSKPNKADEVEDIFAKYGKKK